MSAESNRTLAQNIYAAFSRNDIDGALDGAAGNVEVALIPFGQTFYGRSGFRDFLAGFRDAFPDLTIKVTNQVATERSVVSELTARGTHLGTLRTPAGDIPPTGRTVDFTVCEVWDVRDGKLTSLRNYQDAASILRQLGIAS